MIDAHCHLADPALYPHADELIANAKHAGVQKAIVNGTCPDDWPRVLDLASRFPNFVTASLGLHPWHVNEAQDGWLEQLSTLIRENPHTHIGECGLDRWIDDHDLPRQIDALLPQIDLAAHHDRALTLHCLHAWGALVEILQTANLPRRGFLIHAFNGSYETAVQLADLGAQFSFSTYFLHERKTDLRDIYARLPLDRLLVETDSPHMAPPSELTADSLFSNHNTPANLRLAADGLAKLRPEQPKHIRHTLVRNTAQLFHL